MLTADPNTYICIYMLINTYIHRHILMRHHGGEWHVFVSQALLHMDMNDMVRWGGRPVSVVMETQFPPCCLLLLQSSSQSDT